MGYIRLELPLPQGCGDVLLQRKKEGKGIKKKFTFELPAC